MATRGVSKRQAATFAIQKIQNVLADEECSESKDAGGDGRKHVIEHTSLSTKRVAKMPNATKKKAKGGPEIVKVKRSTSIGANQSKKKVRQNPVAATNQVPVRRTNPPVAQVYNDHGGQQDDYNNGYHIGHQNGALALGMEADAATQFLYDHADRQRGHDNVHLKGASAYEMDGGGGGGESEEKLTASEIRQRDHDLHQWRRARRSRHQYKNRLSYKMRNKIRRGNENSPHTPHYSPIQPLCLAEFHFSPNPGSPPISLDWLFELELEEGDEEFNELVRYMDGVEEL